jgi:hypothetical protein
MPFFEGRAIVKVSDRWGFIDRKGAVVIPTKYDGAFPFSEGLAAVNKGGRYREEPTPRIDGGKWGFVDRAGKTVIAPSYDFVRKFSEGLAPVMTKGPSGALWGYVDNTGQTVIPPRFDEAEEFQGGIARVKVRGKTGYVGRDGKYVWGPAD